MKPLTSGSEFPSSAFLYFFLILHFQKLRGIPCLFSLSLYFLFFQFTESWVYKEKKRVGEKDQNWDFLSSLPAHLPEHHMGQQFNLEQDQQTTFRPLRIVNCRQRRSAKRDFGNPIFNICTRMLWHLLEVWRTFN